MTMEDNVNEKPQVYVAGATQEADRVDRVVEFLEAHGVDVVGKWTDAVRAHGSQAVGRPSDMRQESSEMIRRTLDQVDGVLFLVPELKNATRGAFWEAGFVEALAEERQMTLVAALPHEQATEFILLGGPWAQIHGDRRAALALRTALERRVCLRRPQRVRIDDDLVRHLEDLFELAERGMTSGVDRVRLHHAARAFASWMRPAPSPQQISLPIEPSWLREDDGPDDWPTGAALQASDDV